MKNTKTCHFIIALTIAALAAGAFQFTSNWIQPAKAQLQDGSVKFIAYSLGGIVPGQMVRVVAANLGGDRSNSMAFRSRFLDQHGTLVFESTRMEVRAGGFGKHDVLFGGLGMDSETGTGRKQFRVEVLIEGRNVSASDVIVNLETLNEETAITLTRWNPILSFSTSDENVGTK